MDNHYPDDEIKGEQNQVYHYRKLKTSDEGLNHRNNHRKAKYRRIMSPIVEAHAEKRENDGQQDEHFGPVG